MEAMIANTSAAFDESRAESLRIWARAKAAPRLDTVRRF